MEELTMDTTIESPKKTTRKKTTAPAAEPEKVKEPETEAAADDMPSAADPNEDTMEKAPEEPEDPWERKRYVLLPRLSRGSDESQMVSVNGRKFTVPRGVRVAVPEPVAEVLEFSALVQSYADEYATNIPGGGSPLQMG